MIKEFYTLAVIDDELEEMTLILRFVERIPHLKLLFTAGSGLETIDRLELERPDLLILDINMPGMDGLQLYQSLGYKPTLIVCSGHTKYAYDASKLEMAAYLNKVTAYDDFEHAVLRAIAQCDRDMALQGGEESIFVTKANANGQKVRIRVSKLQYVEMDDKVARFYGDGDPIESRSSLKTILMLLAPYGFVRPHASFLVPKKDVEIYTNHSLTLAGSEKIIPIGRHFRESFLNEMSR